MRKWYWLVGIIIVLVGLFVFDKGAEAPDCYVNSGLKTIVIFAKGMSVEAEIVTSSDDKYKGLSGRECLGQGKGMLFVYELPGDYCFVMRDMKFALDMIWMDDEKRIVTIEEDVKPETYPEQQFCPTRPAQYVLEVNSGFSRSADWQPGDQLEWQ